MRINSSAPSKILFTRGNPNSPLPAADLEELDLNDDDQKTNTEDDDELLEVEKERVEEDQDDEAEKDDSSHPDKSE